MGRSRKPTVKQTLAALKKQLDLDPSVEFEGKFSTKRGAYEIFVKAEAFGAFINDDGRIELHTRILKAKGLPKPQDNDLIDSIHETIIAVLYGGNPRIDPDHVFVVPHIGQDAIKFDDGGNLNVIEADFLSACYEHKLSLEETAELLDVILDHVVDQMAEATDTQAQSIDEILERRYSRRLRRDDHDIGYIN